MMKRRGLGSLCLSLVIGDLSLFAADKVELAEPESDARIKLVRSHVQVSGQLKTAAGADVENVVFHFGGNTYAYVDTGANGLTDNDQLVQLSGTLNLDLLLQSGVIIA